MATTQYTLGSAGTGTTGGWDTASPEQLRLAQSTAIQGGSGASGLQNFSIPAGTNFGQNLGAFYQAAGIDPNHNTFMDNINNVYGSVQNSPFAGSVGGQTPAAAPTGAGAGYDLGSSPFLGQQAEAISKASQALIDQNLNGIRSEYVGNGGFGGSRDAVAQGTAIAQGANYLQGNLANLYGQNWNADQNRGLQQYGMDQGFYTAQRGQDLQQVGMGANLYNQGTQGQWGPINNANGVYGNYTGFGNSTSSSQQGGSWLGAIGGGLTGLQLARNWY